MMGERNFPSKIFKKDIYNSNAVKKNLIKEQKYKCCFCESKIGHISYGDVEHFRPKAAWIQKNEKPNKPGYYWLAYDWNNLLLSCQLCNQRYKKNFFPLINEIDRARSHHYNILNENPIFINPIFENPEIFINFKEEIPISIGNNIRGTETIKMLGLDRELLNEQRRKIFNMLFDIYELAKNFSHINHPFTDRAREKLRKYYGESKKDDSEFSSMLRSFFKNYPLDF